MFAVTNITAKLASMNTRAERHGEEPVPATDLKFTTDLHNAILAHFHPKLRELLYRKAAAGEQPSLLPEDADGLTELALPNMEPLKFNDEFPGYFCGLTAGLDASDVLQLKPVKLYGFRVEPKNGGTVNLSFSVTAHPTQDQVGQLYELIQREVQLTLTPPSAAEQEASPQPELALDGAALRNVLVTAIEVTQNNSTHLFSAKCAFSDGETETVGEWAFRPSLDDIAGVLHDEIDVTVEFTRAARSEYETDEVEA